MYTVGQVAKFLGVSRDTLKFYEEKELVKPKQDKQNGYRKYNDFDIYDVITTNFYREIDIEIKKIQEIRQGKGVEDIKSILEGKEQKIREEIAYKRLLLKHIDRVKEDCDKIKEHLDEYTIKEMKPIEVQGELTDLNAYDEYEVFQKKTDSLKKVVTLAGLRRIISFDESGITENRFVVIKQVEDRDRINRSSKVFTHPKCIYMIIEDGRWLNGEENIDNQVGNRLRKIAQDNGYEPLGIVYVNILLTTYEEGLERNFLEIYAPIK